MKPPIGDNGEVKVFSLERGGVFSSSKAQNPCYSVEYRSQVLSWIDAHLNNLYSTRNTIRGTGAEQPCWTTEEHVVEVNKAVLAAG